MSKIDEETLQQLAILSTKGSSGLGIEADLINEPRSFISDNLDVVPGEIWVIILDCSKDEFDNYLNNQGSISSGLFLRAFCSCRLIKDLMNVQGRDYFSIWLLQKTPELSDIPLNLLRNCRYTELRSYIENKA